MNVILFDQEYSWKNLLPLTYTRPVSEIRIGILTIKQKWDLELNTVCSYLTQDFLSKKFPLVETPNSLFINSSICPTPALITEIKKLKPQQVLIHNNEALAFIGESKNIKENFSREKINFNGNILTIVNVWDIFQKNGEALKLDFELLTKNKKSKPLSNSVTVIGNKDLIFLEEGAKAEACIFNTSAGPIYLAKDAEVMEGSVVRGPFALGEHSALKLSTKIYGPTTIGPHCKVGGEVNNSVIFGFSNKAHDGFLGNSVIAEWCNLGADTNNSNLKNNYGNVKLFNYAQNKMVDSGLQFCGLIMGDHSKSGINTMFNTGTVVGVGANIFGGSFPATHIPSFSWGGSEGFETYRLEKLFETAEKVYERRGLKLDKTEKEILTSIFEQTKEFRN
ncbi:MAG: GlmU family protein [Bacteroidota bacterium]|nr:GlmU family protein [Bacteroidota bacterium]MDP3145564.1 GlmU family protein [Bacteroidota bacterium]MDP3557781.1 GlmU family protein [Bacteroidota bacterium]